MSAVALGVECFQWIIGLILSNDGQQSIPVVTRGVSMDPLIQAFVISIPKYLLYFRQVNLHRSDKNSSVITYIVQHITREKIFMDFVEFWITTKNLTFDLQLYNGFVIREAFNTKILKIKAWSTKILTLEIFRHFQQTSDRDTITLTRVLSLVPSPFMALWSLLAKYVGRL